MQRAAQIAMRMPVEHQLGAVALQDFRQGFTIRQLFPPRQLPCEHGMMNRHDAEESLGAVSHQVPGKVYALRFAQSPARRKWKRWLR